MILRTVPTVTSDAAHPVGRYPDHDLITHKDGPARRHTRGDGSPVHRRQE